MVNPRVAGELEPERMIAARLENQARTIVVTGGNRGIGYALVAVLADRGYRVIFTSRHLDRGRQALARLGEERPAGHPPDGDL